MTNDRSLIDLSFVIFLIASSFDIRASSFTAGVPSSISWSRGIWHCADWLRCESAPVLPSPGRNLRVRQLSSDCWSETGTGGRRDRKGFGRRDHNRANRLGIQAWHLPPPCRDLAPAICRREFLLRARYRDLPAAYKPERRLLPPGFVEAPRAVGFRNHIGASRKRLR